LFRHFLIICIFLLVLNFFSFSHQLFQCLNKNNNYNVKVPTQMGNGRDVMYVYIYYFNSKQVWKSYCIKECDREKKSYFIYKDCLGVKGRGLTLFQTPDSFNKWYSTDLLFIRFENAQGKMRAKLYPMWELCYGLNLKTIHWIHTPLKSK
jgi:hypothetical protein